ncbi:uncharacterized protein LOC134216777 [Armigeres subalbatus]|uniref:uncharacterized protein LOC134216777 n=1 Tax=Armigeres subalbatus TaxID=124917 RepID=UPI002ECFDA8D
MSNEEVPKKIYRYVFQGVSYYTRGQNRACKLEELVAYAYLKNGRVLPTNRLEGIVKNALDALRATGIIKQSRGFYQLSADLTNDLQDTTVAGPSGSASRRVQRKPSRTRKPQSTNKRSKTRRGPVDAEGSDSEAIDDQDMSDASDDENEPERRVEQRQHCVVHGPFKTEITDEAPVTPSKSGEKSLDSSGEANS